MTDIIGLLGVRQPVSLALNVRPLKRHRLGEGFRTPECVQVRWRVGHVTRVEEKRKAGFMYIVSVIVKDGKILIYIDNLWIGFSPCFRGR